MTSARFGASPVFHSTVRGTLITMKSPEQVLSRKPVGTVPRRPPILELLSLSLFVCIYDVRCVVYIVHVHNTS